jgi:hypothetical protein
MMIVDIPIAIRLYLVGNFIQLYLIGWQMGISSCFQPEMSVILNFRR